MSPVNNVVANQSVYPVTQQPLINAHSAEQTLIAQQLLSANPFYYQQSVVNFSHSVSGAGSQPNNQAQLSVATQRSLYELADPRIPIQQLPPIPIAKIIRPPSVPQGPGYLVAPLPGGTFHRHVADPYNQVDFGYRERPQRNPERPNTAAENVHHGKDIHAPDGTPVVSTGPSKVAYSTIGSTVSAIGKYGPGVTALVLGTTDSFTFRGVIVGGQPVKPHLTKTGRFHVIQINTHLSKLGVDVGQTLPAGAKAGEVGVKHLHLETAYIPVGSSLWGEFTQAYQDYTSGHISRGQYNAWFEQNILFNHDLKGDPDWVMPGSQKTRNPGKLVRVTPPSSGVFDVSAVAQYQLPNTNQPPASLQPLQPLQPMAFPIPHNHHEILEANLRRSPDFQKFLVKHNIHADVPQLVTYHRLMEGNTTLVRGTLQALGIPSEGAIQQHRIKAIQAKLRTIANANPILNEFMHLVNSNYATQYGRASATQQ